MDHGEVLVLAVQETRGCFARGETPAGLIAPASQRIKTGWDAVKARSATSMTE
jgi:hypothetical protein